MFDDLNNKNNAAGVNDQPQNNEVAQPGLAEAGKSPTAAEDIFAEVETGNKPEVFRPKTENDLPQSNEPAELANKKSQKFLYIFIGLIAIVLLLVVGFFIFNYYAGNNSAGDLIDEQNVNSEANLGTEIDASQAESETATGQDTVETEAETQLVDTDQDGLTDNEEGIIGTNINSPDTDKDGLFDREEVKVYLTDPLNPDTDNDGYLDGDEVKNGYNPNGPGRLYDINK